MVTAGKSRLSGHITGKRHRHFQCANAVIQSGEHRQHQNRPVFLLFLDHIVQLIVHPEGKLSLQTPDGTAQINGSDIAGLLGADPVTVDGHIPGILRNRKQELIHLVL